MKSQQSVGPSLLVAAGIIIATLVAVKAPRFGLPAMLGAAVMALFIIGTDMLTSRLDGRAPIPSWTGLLLTAAFLVACSLIAFKNASQLSLMIPVLGSSVVMPVVLARRKECRGAR